MTTQIEALKLALEPLEGLKLIHKADIDLAKKLAFEAQQSNEQVEPVAWIVGDDLTIRADWVEGLNWKGSWVDVGRAIPKQWTPVLYTTPPQRKPLTDEEIMNIAKVSCIGISPHEDALNFAKVIEAVHGIKD